MQVYVRRRCVCTTNMRMRCCRARDPTVSRHCSGRSRWRVGMFSTYQRFASRGRKVQSLPRILSCVQCSSRHNRKHNVDVEHMFCTRIL